MVWDAVLVFWVVVLQLFILRWALGVFGRWRERRRQIKFDRTVYKFMRDNLGEENISPEIRAWKHSKLDTFLASVGVRSSQAQRMLKVSAVIVAIISLASYGFRDFDNRSSLKEHTATNRSETAQQIAPSLPALGQTVTIYGTPVTLLKYTTMSGTQMGVYRIGTLGTYRLIANITPGELQNAVHELVGEATSATYGRAWRPNFFAQFDSLPPLPQEIGQTVIVVGVPVTLVGYGHMRDGTEAADYKIGDIGSYEMPANTTPEQLKAVVLQLYGIADDSHTRPSSSSDR